MFSDLELSGILGTFNSMIKPKGAIAPETHRPQPQKKTHYERGNDPYLVFKNVPPSINVEILINLCSAFGRVLRGRQHEQFNMFFVNFATVNDLLNVLEGFKVNSLGMTIELGKMVINQQTKPNPCVVNQRDGERMQQTTFNFNDNQQNSKDCYVSLIFVIFIVKVNQI